MVEIHDKIPKVLERNPDISRRELDQGLGISLGNASYCLRALLDKGWVKINNFRRGRNKLAYAYLLTPQGMKRKGELTLPFLQRKMGELEAIRQGGRGAATRACRVICGALAGWVRTAP